MTNSDISSLIMSCLGCKAPTSLTDMIPDLRDGTSPKRKVRWFAAEGCDEADIWRLEAPETKFLHSTTFALLDTVQRHADQQQAGPAVHSEKEQYKWLYTYWRSATRPCFAFFDEFAKEEFDQLSSPSVLAHIANTVQQLTMQLDTVVQSAIDVVAVSNSDIDVQSDATSLVPDRHEATLAQPVSLSYDLFSRALCAVPTFERHLMDLIEVS